MLNRTTSLPPEIPQGTASWSHVDFRTRFWYTQALNSPDGLGMEIRINAAVGVPTVVLAQKVVQPGTLFPTGVASVSYYLTTVNSVLRELDLKGGVLYFTNGSHLFSDSDPEDYQIRDAFTPGRLLRPNESASAVIRAAAAFMGTLSEHVNTPSDVRREVTLHGVKYLLETKSLQLRNVTVWGTFLLPRAAFMGHIDKKGEYVKKVILAVVVAVLVAGCILIVVLTDPISKEMRLKAQVIENLEARRQAELRSELKTKFLASMR